MPKVNARQELEKLFETGGRRPRMRPIKDPVPEFQHWGTANEMRYISTIGEHTLTSLPINPAARARVKVKMLGGYLRSARKKKVWDGMERKTIIEFAVAELEKQKQIALGKGVTL